MKRDGTDRKRRPVRLLLMLLAVLLLAGVRSGASAAGGAEALAVDPDMILAKVTVAQLGLKGPDGKALQVRRADYTPGRGASDPAGRTPDYTGVVGYVSLAMDPAVAGSSTYIKPFWQVPVYRPSKDGKTMVKAGTVAHKTVVLVTDQRLKYDHHGAYTGWLEVLRLDNLQQCFLHVSCFVTRPYWEFPITESYKYGYTIAVYRESPGEPPMDETGKAYTLRDGTRLLVLYKGAVPANSPDPANLTVQAAAFLPDETGKIAAHIIYFRPRDLKTIY